MSGQRVYFVTLLPDIEPRYRSILKRCLKLTQETSYATVAISKWHLGPGNG
jgi:hypothetical protein